MNEQHIVDLKKSIQAIGRLLWEKELVCGLNGNISARVDEETIILSAHNTCLGLLREGDILSMTLDGELLEKGHVSAEKLLHSQIYKNYPQVKAVIHTHTTYTNAYFLNHKTLEPKIFESKFYLGEVKSIEQTTPSVTDAEPVMEALKNNNIVVLRKHGVVAMGSELFDCFLLIQALEEAVKVDVISRLYRPETGAGAQDAPRAAPGVQAPVKKYKLFGREQMEKIVDLVNSDAAMKELGEQTQMTMELAVQLNETKETYSFSFRDGMIAEVGDDENAEFLITAPRDIWRAVFNREIDPFVATTQKKMNLRGDFARISQWYAPCSRVFELWQQVPVE